MGTTCAFPNQVPTVWSNVTANGASAGASHCNAWNDNNGNSAAWGLGSAVDGTWTNYCGGGGAVCIWQSAIYSFQQ